MDATEDGTAPGRPSVAAPGRLPRAARIGIWLFVAVMILGLILPILVKLLSGGSTDFLTFYAAAQMALDGNLPAAFDGPSLLERQRTTFPDTERLAPFYYPPSYLLVTFWLPALPYSAAQIVFLVATFALFVAAIRPFLSDLDDVLIVVAAPAIWLNVAHGQNAFLTAALAVLACRWLSRRAALAGVALGVLSVKPHLCLLWPVYLLARGRWITILAGLATLAALTVLSAALFGPDAWRAFFGSALSDAYGNLTDADPELSWMASPYAGLLLLGVSDGVALAVHLACALAVAGVILHLVRLRVATRYVLAVLFVAALWVTPHSFTYDWVYVLPGLLIVWQRARRTGFLPFEALGLVLGYVGPGLMALLVHFDLPLGPLFLLAALATVVRRAYAERGAAPARPDI